MPQGQSQQPLVQQHFAQPSAAPQLGVGIQGQAVVMPPPIPGASANVAVVDFGLTAASDTPGSVMVQQSDTLTGGKGKSKKGNKCFKCATDSHTTKACPIKHYCLVCDNAAHPTFRCPTLRLPKPTCFTTGSGVPETMFVQFPDSVYDGYELVNPKRKVMM